MIFLNLSAKKSITYQTSIKVTSLHTKSHRREKPTVAIVRLGIARQPHGETPRQRLRQK